MLHFDIPAYRLPRAELMQEVRRIEAMRVKLVLDHKVEDLLAERDAGGFDAVFVALGAHVARHVDIPARDAARVLDTVSLLHEVGSGEQPRLGRRVVIYGGGSPRVHFSLVVYVEDCTGCGVSDRPNGATRDRDNGATCTLHLRGLEPGQGLPDFGAFATVGFAPFGMGRGAR